MTNILHNIQEQYFWKTYKDTPWADKYLTNCSENVVLFIYYAILTTSKKMSTVFECDEKSLKNWTDSRSSLACLAHK
jgi:hypothetical protein